MGRVSTSVSVNETSLMRKLSSGAIATTAAGTAKLRFSQSSHDRPRPQSTARLKEFAGYQRIAPFGSGSAASAGITAWAAAVLGARGFLGCGFPAFDCAGAG